MKKIMLTVTIILWATSAHAAYWYVDNAATGSNNGTSWANAWQTLAGVVWGAGGVQAGDTLWISGGAGSKIYNITGTSSNTGEMLRIGASGSSGSPIYIKPGAAHPTLSAGHNGTVIFECQGVYERVIYANAKQYIVIDGSDVTYNIVPIGQNTHRKFHFQNTSIGTGHPTLVLIVQSSNIKFLNSEFSTAAYGLYCQYQDQDNGQSEIAGNYFHDIRDEGAIELAGSANNNPRYDAVLIHDNEIQINSLQDNGTGPDGVQGTHGLTIYHNLFYGLQGGTVVGGQHQDLIQGLGIYYKIYNNIFRNPGSTCVRAEWTNNPGGYWQVYNNIFERNDSAFTGLILPMEFQVHTPAGGTVNDFVVANNTIIDFDGNYGINTGTYAGVNLSNAIVENNIIYQSGMPGQHEAIRVNNATCNVSGGFIVDKNLIYKGPSYGSDTITCNGVQVTQPTGYFGQPTFATYSRLTSGNNFALSATDTQAINRGASLLHYFSTDYKGNPRPQGPVWDIGAYQSSNTKRLVAPDAQIIPAQ